MLPLPLGRRMSTLVRSGGLCKNLGAWCEHVSELGTFVDRYCVPHGHVSYHGVHQPCVFEHPAERWLGSAVATGQSRQSPLRLHGDRTAPRPAPPSGTECVARRTPGAPMLPPRDTTATRCGRLITTSHSTDRVANVARVPTARLHVATPAQRTCVPRCVRTQQGRACISPAPPPTSATGR